MVRHSLLRAGLLSALALMLVALPWVAAAQAPSPTPYPTLTDGEAWVAFQRPTYERNLAHGVHLVRTDGTGSFFAAAGVPGGLQLHPDFSPDGRSLVMDADDHTGTFDIWIVDLADGSTRKAVDCSAPCVSAQEPAWSRDGTRIAFARRTSSDAGEISTIEILELMTGEITTVLETDPTKVVHAPRWSSDGASLVFVQATMDGEELLGNSLEIVDIATPGVTRQLIPVEMGAELSDWSRDGRLIAFAGGHSGIWVVAPDGTGMRRVTADAGGRAEQPTFTADSTRIVFKLDDSGGGISDAMASIAIDGTDLRPLVGEAWTYGWHPRLRP